MLFISVPGKVSVGYFVFVDEMLTKFKIPMTQSGQSTLD